MLFFFLSFFLFFGLEARLASHKHVHTKPGTAVVQWALPLAVAPPARTGCIISHRLQQSEWYTYAEGIRAKIGNGCHVQRDWVSRWEAYYYYYYGT